MASDWPPGARQAEHKEQAPGPMTLGLEMFA